MIAIAFILVAGWFLVGLVVAVPFAFAGAHKLPREPAPLSTGARLLLIPGAALLWPLVLKRWLAGKESKSP